MDPSEVDSTQPVYRLLDSLSGIAVTSALAAWLGRELPATTIWDYASIDAMAEALVSVGSPGRSLENQSVIAWQSSGAHPPVFFFPGLSGHPITFAPMAAKLGKEQPCYGLTFPGLRSGETPLTSVEELAAVLVKRIRHVRPNGPYQLAGYSFGGLVAYEAARQLSLNDTVSMLAIYDMFTPAGRSPRPRWQRLPLHLYLLARGPRRVEYLRERLRKDRVPQAESYVIQTNDPRVNQVRAAGSQAIAAYRPGPYGGHVLLFKASQRDRHSIFFRPDKTCGWGTLAGGGLSVFHLPGTHASILDAERATGAADMLRPHLIQTPDSTKTRALPKFRP